MPVPVKPLRGPPPRRKPHTWSSIGLHSAGNSAHVTAAATTAVGVGSTVFTLTPTVIRGAYAAAVTSSRALLGISRALLGILPARCNGSPTHRPALRKPPARPTARRCERWCLCDVSYSNIKSLNPGNEFVIMRTEMLLSKHVDEASPRAEVVPRVAVPSRRARRRPARGTRSPARTRPPPGPRADRPAGRGGRGAGRARRAAAARGGLGRAADARARGLRGDHGGRGVRPPARRAAGGVEGARATGSGRGTGSTRPRSSASR